MILLVGLSSCATVKPPIKFDPVCFIYKDKILCSDEGEAVELGKIDGFFCLPPEQFKEFIGQEY